MQRQQWGSLINPPAYLFWMQVGVYLNIYVTPICYGVIKAAYEKVVGSG